MHKSIQLNTPIELINVTPLNPLISKCQIKVCYVGDTPNRNKSIITKESARLLANSLPGSPIVGFYNETKKDFESHNKTIDISDGELKFKDATRPYGFVDLNAKVWFAKYFDDDSTEREYLVTEGYLWTGQYPECKRVLDKENGHSMELDKNNIDAFWSKDNNGNPQFFIINEAIISKLCILGEDVEPCFEGSNISTPTIQFSFDDGFKEQLFSMINELKDLLNKGGAKVFTKYSVVVGDTLWNNLYNFISKNYTDYSIESVCEEEEQVFAVLVSDGKYYRLNFSLAENGEYEFTNELTEIESYTPDETPQFAADAVAEYIQKLSEDEEKCPKCGKPIKECSCDEDKKDKYELSEIPEYVELENKFSELEAKFSELTKNYETLLNEKKSLETENYSLVEFKTKVEKKEKEAMIKSFYMLTDEDKADVITNIDTYSLDEIEAKLSIICVRNKVNFNLDEDNKKPDAQVVFNLDDKGDDDATTPAWVKAALQVAKTMN